MTAEVKGIQNAIVREFYVQTFMGGEFELKDVQTLGDLKRGLSAWVSELNSWGDDATPITECEIMRGKLIVSMRDGIVG